MGFATNSIIISALAMKGCLIIPDEVTSCFDPIWNQAQWCECWDVQAQRYEEPWSTTYGGYQSTQDAPTMEKNRTHCGGAL